MPALGESHRRFVGHEAEPAEQKQGEVGTLSRHG
jgi:hypothetical protein